MAKERRRRSAQARHKRELPFNTTSSKEAHNGNHRGEGANIYDKDFASKPFGTNAPVPVSPKN